MNRNHSFAESSYQVHETLYESREGQSSEWTEGGTTDAWRHQRMYQLLDPVLTSFPDTEWLTVGDGRCGTDAHYLGTHGIKATASDISDTLLKKALETGYIRAFSKENAERLSFADETFDFVLCKEAYHHFPRPMVALYEMLRVAKTGIVLIEPDDTPSLFGWKRVWMMAVKRAFIRLGLGRVFRDQQTEIIDFGVNWYETVGNFGYGISRREIEKVALGLNLPHVAFKGFNDGYVEGVEKEKLTPESPLFRQVDQQIKAMDRQSRRGLSRGRWKLSVFAIFKKPLTEASAKALLAAGFEIHDLAPNPYIPRSEKGA